MSAAADRRLVVALAAAICLVASGCQPAPTPAPALELSVLPLPEEREPAAGPALPWATVQRARNLLLSCCQRYGPAGPIGPCLNAAQPLARAPRFPAEATPEPVYFVPIATSRPAERFLAIEVKPLAFDGSWLLALLDLLSDELAGWRVGLSVGGHEGVGGYLELSAGLARGTGVFRNARDLQGLLAAGELIRAAERRAADHRRRRLDEVRHVAQQAGLAKRIGEAPFPLIAFTDDSRRWTDPPATLWIVHRPGAVNGGDQLDRHYATLHLFADGALDEAPLRGGQSPVLELVEWALPAGSETVRLPDGRVIALAELTPSRDR